MSPKYFFGRVFHMKYSILFILYLSIHACVNDNITNISDNIVMNQSFAIPIGAKELQVPKPPISDTSSTGPNGTYYYDNLPYPITAPFFTISEDVDFNLSNKPNNNWIKKLTFNILTENSYLTHADLQVYLIGNGRVLDSFFKNSALSINGGVVRRDTIVYEGARLDLLKQVKMLQYDVVIPETSSSIRTDQNKLKVTIGATAELEYNVKDLN